MINLFVCSCACTLSLSRVSVCADNNHVRTWTVTRFRGMISTQPGSTPLASFKILSLEETESHGSYSSGNDIGERRLTNTTSVPGTKVCEPQVREGHLKSNRDVRRDAEKRQKTKRSHSNVCSENE